ncbi:hypothetical protein cyc_01499 [Cyclospora cayetanensis]|uniref:Uncharacterized protein n=1 Tax=Cyclospora cayetanensis TaxID=88456 RepID=A0A1D3D6Y7_9EIME|nr:hypothetical protein cyc_01499 [Cyclospora cayetanensis]
MRKQNSLAESRRDQLHRHMHPMSGEGEASFSSVRGIGGDIKKKRRQSSGSQPSVVATRPVVEAAFSDTLADKAFSDGEISSGGSASLPRDPRAWREELVRIGHLVQQLHTDAEGSSSTYGSSVALQSEEPWLSDTPLAGGSSSRHGNAAGRYVCWCSLSPMKRLLSRLAQQQLVLHKEDEAPRSSTTPSQQLLAQLHRQEQEQTPQHD